MYLPSFLNHLRRFKKRYMLIFICTLAFIGIVNYFYSAPSNFPVGTVVTVEPGDNALSIAKKLKDKGVVRSTILLNNVVIFLGGERGIVSGEYVFNNPLNVMEVAKRITSGRFGILPKKITIPEGLSSYEIAEIFAAKEINFNKDAFLSLATQKEGYLFPDTYYFMSNTKTEDIVEKMSENFNERITSVQPQIDEFGKPLNDVIIMASILEEEARLTRTRQIVAGILWKRLEMGMPLQVDGTFKYINGKGTEDLTMEDLQIDSPYNTYKYEGLPPTAVSNPGLDAITAAVTPIETEYLYFLTDNDGNMHYAKTLEQHVANKDKYLR